MPKLPVFSLVILSATLVSCASVDGPALGDGITLSPGWERFRQRLVLTVQEPQFWAPLAAAAVLQLDDQDQRLSDRLSEDTPVFGSRADAGDASDDLRELTKISYVTTALVAPVGQDASWLATKSKLLLTELAGVEATAVATGSLKDSTERERPDGSNRRSFPSGHTSKATVQAQLAIANTDYLPLSEGAKTGMSIGFNSLAIGTAWARIEAGRHYPSDVLAGWSLGYLASALTQVFIQGDNHHARISTQVSNDSWQITYQRLF